MSRSDIRHSIRMKMEIPELNSAELESRVKDKRKSMIENSLNQSARSAIHYDYEAVGLQTLRTPSPKQQSQSLTPVRAKKKKRKKGKQRAAYHKLFLFADKVDYVLMGVGGTAAVLHGAAVPVFFIYFSRLINDLGHSMFDPKKQTAEVARYSMNFFYLGLHCFITAWLEVSCWMITGERQSARIRTKYLHAMLTEEVGFFDTDSCTSELVSRISSDTLLVQEAIGEKREEHT